MEKENNYDKNNSDIFKAFYQEFEPTNFKLSERLFEFKRTHFTLFFRTNNSIPAKNTMQKQKYREKRKSSTNNPETNRPLEILFPTVAKHPDQTEFPSSLSSDTTLYHNIHFQISEKSP